MTDLTPISDKVVRLCQLYPQRELVSTVMLQRTVGTRTRLKGTLSSIFDINFTDTFKHVCLTLIFIDFCLYFLCSYTLYVGDHGGLFIEYHTPNQEVMCSKCGGVPYCVFWQDIFNSPQYLLIPRIGPGSSD